MEGCRDERFEIQTEGGRKGGGRRRRGEEHRRAKWMEIDQKADRGGILDEGGGNHC